MHLCCSWIVSTSWDAAYCYYQFSLLVSYSLDVMHPVTRPLALRPLARPSSQMSPLVQLICFRLNRTICDKSNTIDCVLRLHWLFFPLRNCGFINYPAALPDSSQLPYRRPLEREKKKETRVPDADSDLFYRAHVRNQLIGHSEYARVCQLCQVSTTVLHAQRQPLPTQIASPTALHRKKLLGLDPLTTLNTSFCPILAYTQSCGFSNAASVHYIHMVVVCRVLMIVPDANTTLLS